MRSYALKMPDGTEHRVRCRDDFDRHFVRGVMAIRIDGEGEASRATRLPIKSTAAWAAFQRFVKADSDIFLTGDCWHFALAAERVFGGDFVAIVRDEKAISHVGLRLGDGRIVDSAGIWHDDEAFIRGFIAYLGNMYLHDLRQIDVTKYVTDLYANGKILVQPTSRDEIINHLDRFAADEDISDFRGHWEDEEHNAFAGFAQDTASILFGDLLVIKPSLMPSL